MTSKLKINEDFIELPILNFTNKRISNSYGNETNILCVSNRYKMCVNKKDINIVYPMYVIKSNIYDIDDHILKKFSESYMLEKYNICNNCSIMYITGQTNYFIIDMSYDDLLAKLQIKNSVIFNKTNTNINRTQKVNTASVPKAGINSMAKKQEKIDIADFRLGMSFGREYHDYDDNYFNMVPSEMNFFGH